MTTTPTTQDLGTTIRLFISSTFLDFHRERDVLQRQVFPMLRQQCTEAGFLFQPIDLRWGVSATASAERQTLRICFEELVRCQERSPDLSLLILLGDRYGTCFLPDQIPAEQVARLRPHLLATEQETFAERYALDENVLPPAGSWAKRPRRRSRCGWPWRAQPQQRTSAMQSCYPLSGR